jgi:hypothetical protein
MAPGAGSLPHRFHQLLAETRLCLPAHVGNIHHAWPRHPLYRLRTHPDEAQTSERDATLRSLLMQHHSKRKNLLIIGFASAIIIGLVFTVRALWIGPGSPYKPGTMIPYDNNPDNVVVYTDIRTYPGAPPPGQECLGRYFPRLRIWGDGLVFLEISSANVNQPSLWSGHLTPNQMQLILNFLNKQGFFDSWTPQVPNPAGTGLQIGTHLKERSFEYSLDLETNIYTQLIAQLLPELQPFSQQTLNDARLTQVLAEVNICKQTPITQISAQAVREKALKIASTDNFHFTAAAGPVSIVRVEKITLQSALQDMQEQQLACSYDSDKESIISWVWVVMMNGIWPQNFPVLTTPSPTYAPWRHLAIVLDATTGETICIGALK